MVLALLVIFPALMAFAAASDLLTMTISNRLSLAVAAGFGVLAACSGLPASDVAMHLATGFAVLTVAFVLFALGWIGGGDAKLAAATSLWLGSGLMFDYLFVAAICGGILTVAVMTLRSVPLPDAPSRWSWLSRLRDPRNGVPYGVALAAGALAVYPHSALWTAVLGG